jgi:hypothetical protein
MEELTFLISVQRVIRGVEIEDDLLRRCGVGDTGPRFRQAELGGKARGGVEEEIDEQGLDSRRISGDPGVAGGFGLAPFQAVERALAGHGGAVGGGGGALAGEHCHDRVMAELVMVVEVLVSESDAGDALHQQRLDPVFDQVGIAMILEAAGKPAGQAEHLVGGAKQQGAGVGGDGTAVEIGHHFVALDGCKVEQGWDTVRGHRGAPLLDR